MTGTPQPNLIEQILLILRSKGTAIHYREITSALLARGTWHSDATSPCFVVGSALTRALKSGKYPEIQRLGNGLYQIQDELLTARPERPGRSAEGALSAAIEAILREAGRPMTVTEMHAELGRRGHVCQRGSVPAAISRTARQLGVASPFVRIERGVFAVSGTNTPTTSSPVTVGHTDTAASGEAGGSGGLPQAIEMVLRAATQPMTLRDIHGRLQERGISCHPRSVSSVLSRLILLQGDGRPFSRVGRGTYAVPSPSPSDRRPSSEPRAGTEELSWYDAAVRVLSEAKQAMHYRDIAERILERGYHRRAGNRPATSLNVIIGNDIRNHGPSSTFIRTEPGVYMLRAQVEASPADLPDAVGQEPLEPNQAEVVDMPAIEAFGMYWRRDFIDWKRTVPSLLGAELVGGDPIDFGGLQGIYLLHDGHQTIYIGRTTEQPLAQRLKQHTVDRLGGRWDRFSWFAVSQGEPGALVPSFSSQILTQTLEALLIEALEPPLNRRRGDGLAESEQIQIEDPVFQRKKEKAMLRSMLDQLASE